MNPITEYRKNACKRKAIHGYLYNFFSFPRQGNIKFFLAQLERLIQGSTKMISLYAGAKFKIWKLVIGQLPPFSMWLKLQKSVFYFLFFFLSAPLHFIFSLCFFFKIFSELWYSNHSISLKHPLYCFTRIRDPPIYFLFHFFSFHITSSIFF